MSVLPPTFPELVAEAETIARVRVIAVEVREHQTPDGDVYLKTHVTVDVIEGLKGVDGSRFAIELLGGKRGDRVQQIPGMPEFTVGQEDFVFVRDNGRVLCPLIAGGHGRYRVKAAEEGRSSVLREDHTPLLAADQVAVPLGQKDHPAVKVLQARSAEAMTPERFSAAIRAELGNQTATSVR